MEKFGLNDRRAVSQQNSVTCEANHAKFETLMQESCAYKNSVKILEIGRRVRPCKATLPKSGFKKKYFPAAFSPPAPIEVIFWTAKRTHVPVDRPSLTWIGNDNDNDKRLGLTAQADQPDHKKYSTLKIKIDSIAVQKLHTS